MSVCDFIIEDSTQESNRKVSETHCISPAAFKSNWRDTAAASKLMQQQAGHYDVVCSRFLRKKEKNKEPAEK